MHDSSDDTLRVVVILGHPRKDSFCAALADQYVAGAEAAERMYVCCALPIFSLIRVCTRSTRSTNMSNLTFSNHKTPSNGQTMWCLYIRFGGDRCLLS